ncbi:hypothetical protein D3C72_1832370 [compost metagenome]
MSPSERGSCAASSGSSLIFFVLTAISFSDARTGSKLARSLIHPSWSSSTSARAWLVGSFGKPTVVPSFTSSRVLCFLL